MSDRQHLITDDFDAIPGILAQWKEEAPAMGVVLLLPEGEKHRVRELQALFRTLDIPLAGAIFPALIHDHHFPRTGAWLLRFDRMPHGFLLPSLNQGTGTGGEMIAAALGAWRQSNPPGPRPTLFMIFDGMLPNIASILGDLYLQLGKQVEYAGVNAGSETFQPMPCLFDRDQLIGNGVLGLILDDDRQVAVKHGYPVSRALMKATSTEGNRIILINDRPALEVYREVIQAEYGVALTAENFYDHAVHFPFGIVTMIDVLVRIPVALQADGSIFCVGEVPPNSSLRLLRAPALEDSNCVATLAESLATRGNRQRNRSLSTFYCAGRRMHLGPQAEAELGLLQQATGATGIHGALTLGEIDTLAEMGMPRFHNASLVCMA